MHRIVRWETAAALPLVMLAREPEVPCGPRRDAHGPPELELRPYTREELFRLFRGGEREADEAEAGWVERALLPAGAGDRADDPPGQRHDGDRLRRRLDPAEDVRMRGQGRLKVLVPRSVAYLLAAAMATARRCVDRRLTDGQCLAIVAAHFVRTYAHVAARRLTNSQRVRERDGGWCTVPGCSAHADEAHRIVYRSQGGHRTALWNQSSGCKFHHTCIHEFGLRLEGQAPDALVWTLDGEPFTGM